MQPPVNMRAVSGDVLTAAELYLVWAIRDAVFAFEQHVEDVDVDGLDLRSDTTHLWIADEAGIVSYVRILGDGDGHKIGRVCTRIDARGHGLAGSLMMEAARSCSSGPLHLNAQGYLQRWYETLGYVRTGADFDEAGIVHVPMILAAPDGLRGQGV